MNFRTVETLFKTVGINLASMYMNSYGNNQDCVDTKVQNRMNQNGDPTGVHVAELNEPRSCWNLE